MASTENSLTELLKQRNLKATATRVEVLQLIKGYQSAIPYHAIQDGLENTDRTTLYRTLNKLLEKGIIHKAHVNEDTYYALCNHHCSADSHSHDHVHFRCTSCEAVTCEYLENEISFTLPQFKIDSIAINLVGLCKNCC